MPDDLTAEERAVAAVADALRFAAAGPYGDLSMPAARAARLAVAALNLPERDKRQFQAGLRAANNAITWNVSCLGCAKQLDCLINQRAAGHVEGEADGRADERQKLAALLRKCSTASSVRAKSAPAEARDLMTVEAAVLDLAAGVVESGRVPDTWLPGARGDG